jgi:predicted phosphodiesterase
MFPVLVIGDVHCSGKNPPERLDDLTTVQWKKLEYIVEISSYHKCPVLCTGDLFNTPLVSNAIMSRMGELLGRINGGFYFVFGNHDLLYHNLEMMEQTALGVLFTNNKNVRHISQFEEDYGREWGYIDWRSEHIPKNARYLLAHRAIVNDNLISSNSWIMDDKDFCMHINDPKLAHLDLVLCGHWHKGYEYHYQNTPDHSIHVINPGVVCRRSIAERDMPTVWVVDLDNPDQYSTPVDLNASPADEVLRRESLKSSIKPHADEIVQFIEQLKSDSLSKNVSFIENLMKIVDNMNEQRAVDHEIRDMVATVQARKEKRQL